MIIHEMEQRSEEWFKVKLGKFSATDFATIANGKKATKDGLALKKAAEIITGTRADSDSKYTNFHMERGTELEDEAKWEFEVQTGLTVREVGFVELDEFTGCSPDGLIEEDGGVEIKCKDNHTHLKCWLYPSNEYKWQIQGSMFVCNRDYWYFVSYNPNFPKDKRLYIEKIERDEKAITDISTGLIEIIENTELILKQWKK